VWGQSGDRPTRRRQAEALGRAGRWSGPRRAGTRRGRQSPPGPRALRCTCSHQDDHGCRGGADQSSRHPGVAAYQLTMPRVPSISTPIRPVSPA